MIRHLARAAMAVALFSATPAFAQTNQLDKIQGPSGPVTPQPTQAVIHNGGSPCVVGAVGCNEPVARPGATYTEATVAVTAGTWANVAAVSTTRQKLIVGDAVGLGCVWSTNSAPAAGQGFPFSLTGTPGSWVFDDPVVFNAIYVKCSSSGVVTVGAS